MSDLLLVRHGQSTWNAEGRWQGQADPPLSEAGEAQAQAAGAAAGSLPAIAAAVCSPLRRARRTAELLAAGVGLPAPTAIDGLQERAAGPWTGLTHAEIDARWPGARTQGRRPEGFEADAALLARVTAALLALDVAAPTLVVAHEGVIRMLERAHGHDPGRLEHLAGRWFTRRDGSFAPDGPRCSLLPPG